EWTNSALAGNEETSDRAMLRAWRRRWSTLGRDQTETGAICALRGARWRSVISARVTVPAPPRWVRGLMIEGKRILRVSIEGAPSESVTASTRICTAWKAQPAAAR